MDEREDDGTLGPCGCVDYHMADCPLMTDRFGGHDDPPEPDDDYDPAKHEED